MGSAGGDMHQMTVLYTECTDGLPDQENQVPLGLGRVLASMTTTKYLSESQLE